MPICMKINTWKNIINSGVLSESVKCQRCSKKLVHNKTTGHDKTVATPDTNMIFIAYINIEIFYKLNSDVLLHCFW